MSIPAVGGNTPPPPPSVTITQPDGSRYTIQTPRATYDPVSKTWTAPSSEEMRALSQTVNRKYGKTLDGEDFLKLLVAQLRYQDPSSPADTADMMAQTGTMAMVERINDMVASVEKMSKASDQLVASNAEMMAYQAGSRIEQRMAAAVSLIGASIAYADPADPSRTLDGQVESVRFDESGPILLVSGADVPLGSVKSVRTPATPAAAPESTTGTTDSTTSGPAPSGGTTETPSGGSTDGTATDGTPAGSTGTDSSGTPGTPA